MFKEVDDKKYWGHMFVPDPSSFFQIAVVSD